VLVVLVVGALVVGALVVVVVVIDVLGVGALVVLVDVLAGAFEGLVVVLLLVLLLLGPRVIGTAVDTAAAVDVGPSSEEADVVAHAAHTAHPAARSAAARRGVIRRASR
jgi:hypothetical protein